MDFRIETYPVKSSGVRYVIRDDYLFAGTKQRAAMQFVEANIPPGTETLLYTSSYNGYGPVVTAFIAKELGLKCVVILALKAFGAHKNSTREEANLSSSVKKCRELRATVIFVDTWYQLISQGMTLEKDKSVWWLPLGFKDENNLFEDLLAEAFLPLSEIEPPIKRLWIVGGSGILSRSLARALPNSHILVVPVDPEGKSFGKLLEFVSSVDNIAVIKYLGPPQTTPYPTIKGYDSRAWDAAKMCGKNGDYVFNVSA